MNKGDRELGLDRSITRRDFLNGVGVALGGSLIGLPTGRSVAPFSVGEEHSTAATSLQDPALYPPGLTGLRGSHPGAFEVAHRLRDGRQWSALGTAGDTGEGYDLVVVGAGISGLAAAYFFRQRAGSAARILLLDNHDDFGGHAKRNEFWHDDRLLIGYGGTTYIEDPTGYPADAASLLQELGIDLNGFGRHFNADLYRSLNLRSGVFFDKETFGTDRLVMGARRGDWRLPTLPPELAGPVAEPPILDAFLAQAPLSALARHDITRLYVESVDYLPDLEVSAKLARLQKLSYRDYLVDVARLHPDTVPFFQARSNSVWAIGIDALPASVCFASGYPGFQGLGLPGSEAGTVSTTDPASTATETVPVSNDPRIFHFPDGNASIARLLVRAMIPQAATGSDVEDIVTARFDYSKLDEASAPVRLRLQSTVVNVRQGAAESADTVQVSYVRGGKVEQVRARHCVLACYNSVIPYLCPELPEHQRQALSTSLKAPMVSTNVLIHDWTAFEKLGLLGVHCPGSYHSDVLLGYPVNFGSYRSPASPKEPMVVHLYHTPTTPGLSAPEQFRAGRWSLLTTTFEDFERKIRDQLARLLSAGGFDPASDIGAITVNRWPHGYCYGYDRASGEVAFQTSSWPDAKRAWLTARRPFGRIAIANADAGANAMTEAAIQQAYRSIEDLASNIG